MRWVFSRLLSLIFGRKPEPPPQEEEVFLSRPQFKDYRHSGSTYEESMQNYQAALREYNLRTGREWSD